MSISHSKSVDATVQKKRPHQPTRKPWMVRKAGVRVLCPPLQCLLLPHFSLHKAALLWLSQCNPQTRGRDCLLLCLPRRLLRDVSHDQAEQAWGHTGDLPCMMTLLPGVAAGVTCRCLLQHSSKMHNEISHGVGFAEHRKSSSLF